MQKLEINKKVQAVIGERKEVLQPGLRTMAGSKNIDKLVLLVRWALKLKEGDFLPKFAGGFSEETGAFWFSFDKDAYFQRGGREVIRDLLLLFNSQGWPMVSCWGSDYWAGAFPRPVKVEPKEEKVAKTEEPKEVIETNQTSKPEGKKVQAPKVIRGRINPRSARIVPVEEEGE